MPTYLRRHRRLLPSAMRSGKVARVCAGFAPSVTVTRIDSLRGCAATSPSCSCSRRSGARRSCSSRSRSTSSRRRRRWRSGSSSRRSRCWIVFSSAGSAGASLVMRSSASRDLLGVVSTALPFTLIAWGETNIDSGSAAIANASMPIFVALLALRFRKDRARDRLPPPRCRARAVGVAVLAGATLKAAGRASPARWLSWSPRSPMRSRRCTRSTSSTRCHDVLALLGHLGDDLPAAVRRDPGSLALAGLGRDRGRPRARAPRHRGGQLIYFRLIYRTARRGRVSSSTCSP